VAVEVGVHLPSDLGQQGRAAAAGLPRVQPEEADRVAVLVQPGSEQPPDPVDRAIGLQGEAEVLRRWWCGRTGSARGRRWRR
jgi:hypothetical protein